MKPRLSPGKAWAAVVGALRPSVSGAARVTRAAYGPPWFRRSGVGGASVSPRVRSSWWTLALLAAGALWMWPSFFARPRGLAPVAPVPAPPRGTLLPTGLGTLVPPAPGGHVVVGFGWVDRAGRPAFQAYARLRVVGGEPLRAIARGVVTAVRDDPAGPGLYALVTHDLGWASLYGGCGTVRVRPAQLVRPGDAICDAPAGTSPADVAFGLLQSGQPVDPAPYVRLG